MSSPSAGPNTFPLTLTAEERSHLLTLVEAALADTRVEVHRTHTPGPREQVQRNEQVLRGLLGKLQQLRG
jgi:hypothetical protein